MSAAATTAQQGLQNGSWQDTVWTQSQSANEASPRRWKPGHARMAGTGLTTRNSQKACGRSTWRARPAAAPVVSAVVSMPPPCEAGAEAAAGLGQQAVWELKSTKPLGPATKSI